LIGLSSVDRVSLYAHSFLYCAGSALYIRLVPNLHVVLTRIAVRNATVRVLTMTVSWCQSSERQRSDWQ